MWLVQSSSRDTNCEDPNCYIFLAGYIFLADYIFPAGEMNIFLINACRPLEDCMSPNTNTLNTITEGHFIFFNHFFFMNFFFP